MQTNNMTAVNGALVLVNQQNGVTIIPQPTPLTRLNYYDGKFLRASDLTAEQVYLRHLVELSNQAGGPGVAYGYSLSMGTGDTLQVGAGLAIDPQGRVLLLPALFSVGVQELIDKSRQLKSAPAAAGKNVVFGDCTVVAETPVGTVDAGDLYLISIAFAEALCGQEDVFGKLCEEACATATDRPYLVEGLIVRATPLQLQTALPTSSGVALTQLHLRSRAAHSYFEDERHRVASLISGDGLRSEEWCFGAEPAGGLDVPIGVLSRAGNATGFVDAWIARRKRIDTPARRYWQWRMAMRPWDVFLAQVLQFQCQLSDLFQEGPQSGGGDNPCAATRTLVREATDTIAKIATYYQTVTSRFKIQPLLTEGPASTETAPAIDLAALLDFQKRLTAANDALVTSSDKVLIDGGIIELPSAGYLPVAANSVISVNDQVRRLLGRGLDLRFCIVRPDFVAHALEEAQHMERISLLEGLDHTDTLPEVDILVPNGVAIEASAPTGSAYEAELRSGEAQGRTANIGPEIVLRGAAHVETPDTGGLRLFMAMEFDSAGAQLGGVPPIGTSDGPGAFDSSVWGAVTASVNPFAAQAPGQLQLEVRGVSATALSAGAFGQDLLLSGTLTFERPISSGSSLIVSGKFSGSFSYLKASGGKPPVLNNSTPRLSLDVYAVLSTLSGQAPSLRVSLINSEAKLRWDFTAGWSGSPLKILLNVTQPAADQSPSFQSTSLFDATFTRNDDVMLPTNALHLSALAALDKLVAAIAGTQFRPASEALLFPAPPPATGALNIRAVLDWVLFQRRRTRRCEIETPVTFVASRRYQVWEGIVANQDALTQTISAIQSGKALKPELVFFKQVAVAEFAPGVQALISDPGTLHDQWIVPHPGPRIFYAAIASNAAAVADGPALAKARLGEVISHVSALDPSAVTEVLAAIPDELATPNVDGVIFGLTLQQTNCLTLIRLRSQDFYDKAKSAILSGDFSTAQSMGTVLGSAQFFAGTGDVKSDSLAPVAGKFNSAGPAGQVRMFAVTATGNADMTDAIAFLQAQTVLDALGTGPAPELTPRLKLSDCPIVIFAAVVPGGPFFSFNATSTKVTLPSTAQQAKVADYTLTGKFGIPGGIPLPRDVQFSLNLPAVNPASNPPKLILDDGAATFTGIPVPGSPSSYKFPGIPIDLAAPRKIVITNVLVNAADLTAGGGGPGTVIVMNVTITPAVLITNFQQIVATL